MLYVQPLSSIFRFCLYSTPYTKRASEWCVLCASLVQLEANIDVMCNNPFLSSNNKWVYMCCCLHHWQPPPLGTVFVSSLLWRISNMDGCSVLLRYSSVLGLHSQREALIGSCLHVMPWTIYIVQVRPAVAMSKLSARSLTVLDVAGILSAGELDSTNWLQLWGQECHVTVRWLQLTLLCILCLSTISLPCRSSLAGNGGYPVTRSVDSPITQCKFDCVMVLLLSLSSNFLLQVSWGSWESILEIYCPRKQAYF